nr:hypothetical protein [Anaerolineae bacterium]
MLTRQAGSRKQEAGSRKTDAPPQSEGYRSTDEGYTGNGQRRAIEQRPETRFRHQAGQAQPPDRPCRADSRYPQPVIRP